MRSRIEAFDFTRVLCTFGIILFHYSILTASDFKPAGYFYNGAWGDIYVGIFFMLSGGLLYVNNRKTSLATFYFKRWKSIFPSFYIGYILCFLITLPRDHAILIKPLRCYIPTILGMDGMLNTFGFSERIPTAYLIGEWFLGAIIICYLFMPAVIKISKKADLVLLVVFFVFAHVIKIGFASNVFSWLLYMQIGIVFVKWNVWQNGYAFLISLITFFFLSYIRVELVEIHVREVFVTASLFVVLSYLGRYIMNDTFLRKPILELSKWSFCIYLLHHMILDNVFKVANSVVPAKAFVELMFVMVASTVAGFLLNTITLWVERLPVFARKGSASSRKARAARPEGEMREQEADPHEEGAVSD